MADSVHSAVPQSTTHREWIPYVIEHPIGASTESHVRIEPGADASHGWALSNERLSLEQANVSHKV